MSAAATRIAAERVVVASPRAVFTFGTVRMRGPLGLGRTARTRVVEMHPDTSLAGIASVGNGTEALVRWTLAPESGGTRVRLEASVSRVGRLESVLLAAGGRRWLEQRFSSILQTLARRVP